MPEASNGALAGAQESWTASPKSDTDREAWPDLVMEYSRRTLTFSSDVLIALSGIARIVHSKCHVDYVAGLWRDKLEAQLLWHSGSFDEGARRAKPYRAPSWSWASIEGNVILPRTYEYSWLSICIEILSVEITPTHGDIFGQLSSAKLFIRCEYLLRATIICDEPWKGIVRMAGRFLKCAFRFDSADDDISGEVYILPLGSSPDSLSNDGTLSGDASLSDDSSLPDQETVGLVLKAAETQGEYRRVATFTVPNIQDVAIHDQDSSYHDSVQIPTEQDNSPVDFFEVCKNPQYRASDAEYLPIAEEENESSRGNEGRIAII
jgi:hypothetical protein